MRLVSFKNPAGATQLGLLQGSQVLDLNAGNQQMNSSPGLPHDMIQLLEQGLDQVKAIAQWASDNPAQAISYNLDQIALQPPVITPRMVVALGRNYAAHAKEGGAEPPAWPMLFHKTSTSLLGAGGTIVIPPVTRRVDYEGELAAIIGRTCKQVSEENALDYVAGYCVANDVSARDLQRRTSQFAAGKMLDTFGPLGPALVTADEVGDPNNLWIKTRLNGQLMQDDTTANMIFNTQHLISYISQICTLNVGDVILTGTPEGVGYPRNPPVFLQDGDHIEVEIENLGVLANRVKNQD